MEGDDAANHDGSSFSCKLPLNAESHAAIKPSAQGVLPPKLWGREVGVSLQRSGVRFSPQPRSRTAAMSEAKNPASRRDTPTSLYATASRNSAMSFSWSSTQSPGLRE